MKKIAFMLLVVLVLSGLFSIIGCEEKKLVNDNSQAAAKPKISVNAPVDSFSVGEIVSMNVTIAGVSELYGFQFDIGYDPVVLEFQKAENGNFLSGSNQDKPFCVDYAPTPGLVKHISCAKLGGEGVDGNGVLETISFKVLTNGKSTVTLLNVKLAKQNADAIDVNIENAEIIIK